MITDVSEELAACIFMVEVAHLKRLDIPVHFRAFYNAFNFVAPTQLYCESSQNNTFLQYVTVFHLLM
jgi:hypothetical protein